MNAAPSTPPPDARTPARDDDLRIALIEETIETQARRRIAAAEERERGAKAETRRAQRAYAIATELWAECPVPSQSGCRCQRCREGK